MNQRYRETRRRRQHHSQNLEPGQKINKRVNSERKSVLSRLLLGRREESAIPTQRVNSPIKQTPFLRITSNSGGLDNFRKSKILLKPLTSRQQKSLSYILEQKQQNQQLIQKQERNDQLGELQVQQIFYRQVRIHQQFKRLAQLIE